MSKHGLCQAVMMEVQASAGVLHQQSLDSKPRMEGSKTAAFNSHHSGCRGSLQCCIAF